MDTPLLVGVLAGFTTAVSYMIGYYQGRKHGPPAVHVNVDWDSIKQGLKEPGQIAVHSHVNVDWTLIMSVLSAEDMIAVPKGRLH